MTLLKEAFQLGQIVANVRNIHDVLGLVSIHREQRALDALERLDVIRDVLGSSADDAYAAGFDEEIDFSPAPEPPAQANQAGH